MYQNNSVVLMNALFKKNSSFNYCSVTCTEYPVNIISWSVRKSFLSYSTACPIDSDIVVQTVNVTPLCNYHCVSFKIHHCINPSIVSILQLLLLLVLSSTLIYAKFYSNLGLKLMYYTTQHKCFLLRFFNCLPKLFLES